MKGRDQGGFRAALNRNTSLLILGGAIANVPIGFVLVALPVYLFRLPTFETTLIGVVLTVVGLTATVLFLPLGLLADRLSRRRILALGGILASLSLFLLGFAESFVGLLAFAVLFGGAVDANARSAASAVTAFSFRLPFALSATLGAYLLTVDLSLPFFVTGVLYAFGTVAFWAFFRGYETPEAGTSAA